MSRTKTPLEMAAMMIVLESSNKITRSTAATAYVRQKLIGDLEQALRDAGWKMDDAIKSVLDSKKRERKASKDRIRQLEIAQRKRYPHLCDDCFDRSGPTTRPPRQDGRCCSCGKPLEVRHGAGEEAESKGALPDGSRL